ncbi:unnamed protein product [Hanseniaspora opuntiae]
MSFNFNSNNKAGDAIKLTTLQQLAYKPIENELKNSLYPDFPSVSNPKDIIQLLLMHVFEPTKTKELIRDKALTLDYNEIMRFLQADKPEDNKFDTLLYIRHNCKLIGLPKNSYFSINAKQKVLLHGIFMLKYNSKDKQVSKNAVYVNITKNVAGYITE